MKEQRRAIIMGATSGIGLEVAKVLAGKGWLVGIAGRRQELLQQIQRKHLNIVATEQIDVTKADATKRFVNHYLECLTQLCYIRRLHHISIHDIRPGFVRTPLISGSNYPLQLNAAKVAQQIVKGVERGYSIITIDWRYRLLVFFWRLIPRWLWVRMRIV
jgi:short-subunit dehydrogenase